MGQRFSVYRLVSIVLLISLVGIVSGQNNYNVRLQLDSLNLQDSIACYNFEISNAGQTDWVLANYNISFLFDASVACYRDHNLLLSDVVYDDVINQSVISATGTGLPYEDSLGFMRVGLSANDTGDTIRSDGSWLPTIQICFDLKIENITDPSTCWQANFVQVAMNPLNIPPSIVQEWITDTNLPEVLPNMLVDVVPNADFNSCFVLAEDTDDLCSDGIDNDADGLLDCNDDECGPGTIVIDQETIECFRPEGAIFISGGNDSLRYSIDGAQSFLEDSSFTNLPAGVYNVVVRKTNITVCDFTQTMIIVQPNCDEADEASCTDGMDNDGDGLIDCNDDSCIPIIEDVVVSLPDNCPQLSNGIIELVSSFPNVEFSVDSGRTFIPDPIFSNLLVDTFYVAIRNLTTLCDSFYSMNPVILSAGSVCLPDPENCLDGVDNDLDGLVDCADPDCLNEADCDVDLFYAPNIMSLSSIVNNDEFRIYTELPTNITSLSIYDRWGNLVHLRENTNTADDNHIWDGRFQGATVSNGVYVFFVQLNIGGVDVNRTGSITVIN